MGGDGLLPVEKFSDIYRGAIYDLILDGMNIYLGTTGGDKRIQELVSYEISGENDIKNISYALTTMHSPLGLKADIKNGSGLKGKWVLIRDRLAY